MHRPPRALKYLTRRRGVAAPFVIFALAALFAMFALAVNKAWLWSVREELKTAADAAALAATHTLVDDDLIRDDESLLPLLLTRATTVAGQFAAANIVRNNPLQLVDNPDNANNGDLVFGVITTPRAGDFTPVTGLQSAASDQVRVNTVAVHARQTQARGNAPGLIFGIFAGRGYADVLATSAATFDRGARGIKPRFGPTPLAPVGILRTAWETLVAGRTAPDLMRFDKNLNAFVADPSGDRIHEFVAVYPTDPAHLPAANVLLLQFGTADAIQIAGQLENQMTGDDLATFGRKFVLPEQGGQAVPALAVGPPPESPEIIELARVLNVLRQDAVVRIWPLYDVFNGGQAIVTGFVVARVVTVTPPAPDTPLTFTLQATVIARPDVVTDTDLRGAAATMNDNPYLGRVRRIE